MANKDECSQPGGHVWVCLRTYNVQNKRIWRCKHCYRTQAKISRSDHTDVTFSIKSYIRNFKKIGKVLGEDQDVIMAASKLIVHKRILEAQQATPQEEP